jgi:hypothetical protein
VDEVAPSLAMAFRFDRILLFGEGIVPWKKFDHPRWRDRDRRTQEGLGANGALLHD